MKENQMRIVALALIDERFTLRDRSEVVEANRAVERVFARETCRAAPFHKMWSHRGKQLAYDAARQRHPECNRYTSVRSGFSRAASGAPTKAARVVS
jgi:hypothetical protein